MLSGLPGARGFESESMPGFNRRPQALDIPEVLARIMQLAGTPPPRRASRFRATHIPPMKMTEVPRLFMLVSKFWLEVALSTPSLWSTFVVTARNPRDKDTRHLPALLDMHLQRSRNCPLTIAMSFTFSSPVNDDEPNPLAIIRDVLQKAQEGQERWETVMFRLHGTRRFSVASPVPINLSIRLGETPILNQLDVDVDISPDYLSTQLELSRSPLLQSLSLKESISIIRRTPNQDTELTDALFPQLSTVSLYPFQWDARHPLGYWTIFEQAVNIESIYLDLRRPEDHDVFHWQAHPLPKVVLPKLQSLDVDFREAMYSLPSISAPSLISLDLRFIYINNGNFARLADNTSSIPLKLLSLELTDFLEEPVRTTTLHRLMESFGGLEHLAVQDSSVSFLNSLSLAVKSSPSRALPHLTTLDLDFDRQRMSEGRAETLFVALKDLILAFIRKHFHITIRVGNLYIKDEEQTRIRNSLRNDSVVMACRSETFKIDFNGLELGASA